MKRKDSGMCLRALGLIWILAIFSSCTDSGGQPVDGGPQGMPTDKSVWDYSRCILPKDCPRDYVVVGVSTWSACASSWKWRDTHLANRQGDSTAALHFAGEEAFARLRSCEEYSAWDLCSEEEQALFADHEEPAFCRDNKLFCCASDGPPGAFRRDCASAGLTCVDGPGQGYCGLGSCDEEAFENGCDEEILTRCEGDQIQATDCGGSFFLGGCDLSGGTQVSNRCGERSDGIMGCIGDGEDCDESSFERHCDGSVMETCC